MLKLVTFQTPLANKGLVRKTQAASLTGSVRIGSCTPDAYRPKSKVAAWTAYTRVRGTNEAEQLWRLLRGS